MRDQKVTRNPIAPSLSEFLKDGGAETYIPRPEWCRCFSSEDEYDLISVNSMENNSYLPCHDCGERCFQSGSIDNSQWERGLILDHSEFSAIIPNPPLSLAVPVTEHNVENHDTAAAFARSIIYHKVYPGLNQSPRSITFDVQNIRDIQDGQLNTKHEVSSLYRENNESIQDNSFFGKDKNSALHVAIKNNCKAAALKLIQYGANPAYRNRNGVTPLVLAAQNGDLDVIIALLEHGANPCESNGHSSALIEACHFGNYDIVKILLEKGAFINQKTLSGTTALMRASQEGHTNIVKLLISHNADIECKNQEGMNALILASRRGHSDVVQSLLRIGCRVNESTSKQSTALMLACKHGHSDIALALMTHGAELSMKDIHGRSAVSFAERNVNMSSISPFLTIDAQLYFMRKHEACQRSFMFIKMWKLFNENRASICAVSNSAGRKVRMTCNDMHDESKLSQISEKKQVMVRTMTLPLPLVGLIASFMPLPVLVEKHWEMLQRRRNVDPTSSISCALDLIDDILESIGFLDACDKSKLVAPTGYRNWSDWRIERLNPQKFDKLKKLRWYHSPNPILSSLPIFGRDLNVENPLHCYLYALHMRREASFLQILAHRSQTVGNVLVSDYKLPRSLLKRLQNISNIQSLFFRLGTNAIRFNEIVAAEMIALTRELLYWFLSQENEQL